MSDNASSASRRHPWRLPACDYRDPGRLVSYCVTTHRRRPFLTRGAVPGNVRDLLLHNAEQHGCAIVAYCIMPDHVHYPACIVGQGDLVALIEGFKRDSGYALGRLGLPTPVWQRSYWDRHVRDRESPEDVVEYILMNPVEAELCERIEDWPHSEFIGYPG